MANITRTAHEWLIINPEVARRFKRDAIPAIAERQQRELPNGTDGERAVWTVNFLEQYPQQEDATQPPANIRDYTPTEMLDWEHTGTTKMSTNPRGINNARPQHPAMLRRADLDDRNENDND
jgi:hypothetical protein